MKVLTAPERVVECAARGEVIGESRRKFRHFVERSDEHFLLAPRFQIGPHERQEQHKRSGSGHDEQACHDGGSLSRPLRGT